MSPRKVTIIEDSSTMRILLESIIESDPRLQLVSSYSTAERAIANLPKDLPDVISLDIMLPGMDGHDATEALIHERPTPIVIVSSVVADQVSGTMKALKNGALAAIPKPSAPSSSQFDRDSRNICDTLYNMSNVKVLRQFARRKSRTESSTRRRTSVKGSTPTIINKPLEARPKLIAIGSSTGGPGALETFFKRLTPLGQPPIVLVQHISPGFSDGLSEWLESVTPHSFSIAQHGTQLESGKVYIAPDDQHLTVGDGHIAVSNEPSNLVHRPSVDVLFESVAKTYGKKAVGLLFTGMGRDGAEGLLKLKQSGGWTVAQNEASCVVYGMPRAAVEIGGVCAQMDCQEMANQINHHII